MVNYTCTVQNEFRDVHIIIAVLKNLGERENTLIKQSIHRFILQCLSLIFHTMHLVFLAYIHLICLLYSGSELSSIIRIFKNKCSIRVF